MKNGVHLHHDRFLQDSLVNYMKNTLVSQENRVCMMFAVEQTWSDMIVVGSFQLNGPWNDKKVILGIIYESMITRYLRDDLWFFLNAFLLVMYVFVSVRFIVNVTLTSQRLFLFVLVKPSNMTLSHGHVCITSVVSSVATPRMMPPALQTQRFKKVTTQWESWFEVKYLQVNMHCKIRYFIWKTNYEDP